MTPQIKVRHIIEAGLGDVNITLDLTSQTLLIESDDTYEPKRLFVKGEDNIFLTLSMFSQVFDQYVKHIESGD